MGVVVASESSPWGVGKSRSIRGASYHLFGETEAIATITVGSGGASSIEFSSIPSTYTHLQISWIARSAGSTATTLNLNINSDTSTSAYWHSINGNGTSVASTNATNTYIQVGSISNSTDLDSVFGAGTIDLMGYAVAGKSRIVYAFSGKDSNSSGSIRINSGARHNTAAVTTITLTPNAAENFAQYSTATLYGING